MKLSKITKKPSVEGNMQIPRHIAIIMDGNGRWAKSRGLPRIMGHRQGSESARRIIESCAVLGVRDLTLYAFSSENWNRPEEEVKGLMELLMHYIKAELSSFKEKGARLRIMGNTAKLPFEVRGVLTEAEKETISNTRINVNVALSYGGRREIVDAAKILAAKVRDGLLDAEEINEALFADSLYIADMPEPDLLIRTGGDTRISNFLLWQIAYTELYFTETLWPDFGQDDLMKAINSFSKRERRYGRV